MENGVFVKLIRLDLRKHLTNASGTLLVYIGTNYEKANVSLVN